MTKMFTGVAILQLDAAGRLHVADSVERYLGPFPAGKQGATIEQLASHTAGLIEAGADLAGDTRAAFVQDVKQTPRSRRRGTIPVHQCGLLAARRHHRAGERWVVRGLPVDSSAQTSRDAERHLPRPAPAGRFALRPGLCRHSSSARAGTSESLRLGDSWGGRRVGHRRRRVSLAFRRSRRQPATCTTTPPPLLPTATSLARRPSWLARHNRLRREAPDPERRGLRGLRLGHAVLPERSRRNHLGEQQPPAALAPDPERAPSPPSSSRQCSCPAPSRSLRCPGRHTQLTGPALPTRARTPFGSAVDQAISTRMRTSSASPPARCSSPRLSPVHGVRSHHRSPGSAPLR